MPQLVSLRLEVALVVRVGGDAYRNPLDYLETETLEAVDLLGVVGEQADLADAEVIEDLAPDAVIPLVRGMSQRLIGLYRVESAVLQVVGVQLVEQADA